MALNLIENAFRHTPARHARARERARRVGDRVRLVVEDDGPGVPEELRDEVFERFVRGEGDRGGSVGLGLSIVRAVARSHGGDVVLEAPAAGRRALRRDAAGRAAGRWPRRHAELSRAGARRAAASRPRRRPAAPSGAAAGGRRRTRRGRRAASAAGGRSRGSPPRRRAPASRRRSRGCRRAAPRRPRGTGTPRKMISGSATEEPSCSEIVATTTKMPSALSMRRSRSATSVGSPMSTPSTKIMPGALGRAERGARSRRSPAAGRSRP